jgi:hypothetical protein
MVTINKLLIFFYLRKLPIFAISSYYGRKLSAKGSLFLYHFCWLFKKWNNKDLLGLIIYMTFKKLYNMEAAPMY